MCERWVETGTDCYIDPSSSLDHSSTSSSSWVAQPWVTEGSKPSVCHWLSLRHLDSNWLEPSRAPGYIIFWRSPDSAVLPLISTCTSLDWRLGRGSIYNRPPRGLVPLIAIVQEKKGKVRPVMDFRELNNFVDAYRDNAKFCAQKLREWRQKGSNVATLDLKRA